MADHDDDTKQNDSLLEKPPSPVLSNKNTRKYLLAKRMQRKSRVKLTDRFSEDTSKHSINLNDTCNSAADTTLTLSSFDEAQLEKIEAEEDEIEKNEIPMKDDVTNDFDFKKPESPFGPTKSNETIQLSARSEGGGFKTASGVELNFSADQMKQSRKLFADILNSGESPETSRSNKYAFLSKKRSVDFEQHTPTDTCVQKRELLSTSKDNAKSKGRHLDDNLLLNSPGNSLKQPPEQPSLSFQTASGKGVRISESAYNIACKKFSDDLSHHELKSLSNFEQIQDVSGKEEVDILSTQETNELFSNFTISETKSNATHMTKINEGNFKGFAADVITQSRKRSNEIIALIRKLSKEIKLLSFRNQYRLPNEMLKVKKKSLNRTPRNMNFKPPFVHGQSSVIATGSKNISNTKRNQCSVGFSLASGKKIHVTESALKSARNKFGEEIAEDKLTRYNDYCDFKESIPKQELSYLHCDEFFTNSNIDGSKSALQKDELFGTYLEEHFKGFHDESIEESRIKAKAIVAFFEEFSDPEKTLVQHCKTKFPLHDLQNETLTPSGGFTNVEHAESSTGFQTAAGRSVAMSKHALKRAKQIFQNIDDISINNLPKNDMPKNEFSGFKTATGNAISLSEDSFSKAKQLFQSIDIELSLNDFPKKSTIQTNIKTTSSFHTGTLSENNSSKTGELSQNIDIELCLENSTQSTTSTNVSLKDESHNLTSKSNRSNRKKRLGITSCKQISIPKHKIEQAMRVFEDKKSPIRSNKPTIYNSTPLRSVPLCNIDSDITPIKTVICKQDEQELECADDLIDDRVLIRECTKGTVDSWNKALENEKRVLETKLKIVEERQKVLNLQKRLTENSSQEHQKRRNGILYDQKQTVGRISLKDFMKVDTSSKKPLNITPQNAELVHFNYTEQDLPYIHTSDGAYVIPSIDNHIGLSEIETAFKVMPGIDPKLIPSGWIRNHFKWIIWKLASYENFSSNVNNCLTVENVIQQLKYRYDREIDRAERSTLRKIFEMDDAPQKRMVLCVSNIFNVMLQNDQFELELTDGWYSIRTIIDEPLCKQVTHRKIWIGTKLIICGAELLNCEGCHPLEAIDMIRLKISCNSTRRTRWYVKLGYQRCPEPFPVKLCSVFPAGGLIGCIRICIARVYPVKYMEKQNKLTVWRNRKAEELRAQEWENKGRQEMEKLRETITRDYEMSMRTSRQKLTPNFTADQIKNINCPETLFNFYQNNKDPEKFQEILSSSQMNSIVDYQRQILFRQQQDISRKLEDSVSKLQIPERDVAPVLQMLVIDILDRNEKACVFQIWRPSNEHVEVFKESSVFEAYNILPKKNGDLCTMSRTRFQTYSNEWSHFQKYKRTVLSISQVISTTNKPPFNEFDTVGVVVAMSTDGCSQSLWLADECGRLLYIKVFEGPKNCLLFDNLKIGQLVAASNLVFCESKLEFGEAIANHLTVISCYPKAKHLEDGISALNKELPKDLNVMLTQSQQKISYYINKVDITRDYKNKSSTSLVTTNSLLTSDIFDDSSDVLFSMIDVDRVK